MPTKTRHETQWAANHQVLQHLRRNQISPEWTVTVAFYTALHSLERFLADRNEHPADHRERKQILTAHTRQLGAQTLRDYLDMYNASITARYECIPVTTAEVQDQLARLKD